MSHCAMKYLACLREPFSEKAAGACLPYPPDRDSLKVTVYARFNIQVGTSGDNRILVAPCLSSNSVAIWYSQSDSGTVPFTTTVVNTPPTNWSALSFSNLPFTSTQINQGLVAGRIVSVGIRMTYTGKVTDMGGAYYSWVSPGHESVNIIGNDIRSGTTTLLGNQEVRFKRVTDKPMEEAFTVTSDAEHMYYGYNDLRMYGNTYGSSISEYPWSKGVDVNGNNANSASYTWNGAPCIIFGVTGGSGAYYVEVVQHVEYVGRAAMYGLTPSHNDHNAANLIQKAAESAVTDVNNKPDSSWASIVANAMRTAISSTQTPLGQQVVGAAARVAMNGIGRRMGQLAIT